MEGLKFSIGLQNDVTPAAAAAGTSIRKLATELTDAKGKLAGFQAQLTRAKSLGDIAGYQKYTDLVNTTKRSVFDLTQTIDAAGGAPKKLGAGFLRVVEPAEVMRHAFAATSAGITEFASSIVAGDLKGAVSGIADTFAGLATTLDLVYPGLGQVASAAIKVGGAFAAATVGVIEFGVKTALAVGEVNERLFQTFQAFGKGPDAGGKTLDFLNKLSTQLPQSRDQLAEWTQKFQAMGVTDLGQLRQQIKATAAAQANLPKSGAEA